MATRARLTINPGSCSKGDGHKPHSQRVACTSRLGMDQAIREPLPRTTGVAQSQRKPRIRHPPFPEAQVSGVPLRIPHRRPRAALHVCRNESPGSRREQVYRRFPRRRAPGCSSGRFAAVSLLSGTDGTPDSPARFARRSAVLGMPKLSTVQGNCGRRLRRTMRPFTPAPRVFRKVECPCSRFPLRVSPSSRFIRS
jgi:hypothetical protein